MTPKQIAAVTIDGKLVPIARTYDVSDGRGLGAFALQVEGTSPIIYRDKYDVLKRMIDRRHPEARWLEASQYDI